MRLMLKLESVEDKEKVSNPLARQLHHANDVNYDKACRNDHVCRKTDIFQVNVSSSTLFLQRSYIVFVMS